jgi:hypothetical protein
MPLLLSFHEKDFEPLLWIEYLDFGFGTAVVGGTEGEEAVVGFTWRRVLG